MIEFSILLAPMIGLAIGVTLGTLGGGGSILAVPALVYLLGQDPHTAITSSLLIVGVTAFIGLLPHLRRDCVRVAEGVTFGLLGIVGAYVGSRLSDAVDANILLLTFSALIFIVVFTMLWRVRRCATSSDIMATPDCRVSEKSRSWRRSLRVVVAATLVGLLTGFFGVGGGFILVPALIFALDFTMPTAVGTSLLVIAINSATALLSRIGSAWDADWLLMGLFIVTAIIGSILGGNLAGRLPARQLSIAFAVLLVMVAIFTGIQSLILLD